MCAAPNDMDKNCAYYLSGVALERTPMMHYAPYLKYN